jgi:hypothetical protein
MAKYINRIPDAYKSGIRVIIALSDENLSNVIKAFKEASVVLNVREFNQKITDEIDFLQPVEAKSLVDALGSLYELRLDLDISSEEFVDEVVSVTTEDTENPLELSLENVDKFKERLYQLLNIESLSLRTKAANLIVDNQNIFRDAKLISDIRPVFGTDVEDLPVGTVLVHTLKIDYIENEFPKSFHIALDDKDVEKLITLLKRTQLKAESLRKLVKSVGLSNYEVE